MPATLAELDDIGIEAGQRANTVWGDADIVPTALDPHDSEALLQAKLRLPSGQLVIVEYENQLPSWLPQSVNNLVALLRLPDNWNSYGAHAIHETALLGSLKVLAEVMGRDTPAPAVVPTVQGGIQLEWHLRDIDIEVRVENFENVRASVDDFRNGTSWESERISDFARIRRALTDIVQRQA